MENRLHWQRLLPHFVMMACFLSFSTLVHTQSFTLTYAGPDTLYVDNDCRVSLDWGHPDSISFTATNGNKIDTFYVDTISGGYTIGSPIRASETIFISYFVEDTTGFSEVLDSALKIVIADNIAPIFDSTSLPSDTIYKYLSEVPTAPNLNMIVANDNCGVESIIFDGESTRPSACVDGTFTRTWTAKDTTGNSAAYIQNITIEKDTTAPTWTLNPSDLIISCNATVNVTDTILAWLTLFGNGMAIDSSGVSITNDYTDLADSCGITGTAAVTFTATDSCGNMAIIQANIQVKDETAPVINVMAVDTIVFLGNSSISLTSWLANHGNALATDFCTTIDNSDTSAHWSIVNIDTTTNVSSDTTAFSVTFEVKDDCGNADSTMATYTRIDTIGVNIVGLIRDTTGACGGVTASNRIEQWFDFIKRKIFPTNSGGDATFVEVNYTDRDGVTGTWTSLAIPFPNFVPQFDCTWYLDGIFVFRDTFGRLGTDTARFSFIDTIQPVLVNVPNDTSVACDQIPIAATGITAMDNCDTMVVVTFMEKRDTVSAAIIITRTWIATDDCNNIGLDSQIITAIDTVAPVLENIPADTIVDCDAIPFAPIILTATDNCTDIVDITFGFRETFDQQTHPDSCQTYNYTLTRTWIVTDAFNNSDSLSQIIRVVDTVAPTFTVPSDVTVSCEFRDSLSATGQPTNVSDNCDFEPGFSFVDLVIGGDCVGGGALDTIFRTWIVTDACGNIKKDTQRIILIDTIGPNIIGLAMDTSIQCNVGIIPMPNIGTDITAIDNCSNNPIVQFIGETDTRNSNPDSCDFYNYTILRTWRATDACGNTNEFSQTITIFDTIAPTIICPNDIIVANTTDSCEGTVVLPKPFYFDDCTGINGKDSLALSQDFTNPPGTDANSTPVDALIFNFNIGGAAPSKTITSEVILTIQLNGVDGEGVDEFFNIFGEDGTVFRGTNLSPTQCGNSTTSINISAALANNYALDSVITITLSPSSTGTDAINNICAGGNATVTIEYDFEKPSNSIQLNYSIDGGAEMNFPPSANPTLAEGDHTLTYFATDCSGNISSCNFMVSMIDRSLPTFDCPVPMTLFTDSSSCDASVTLPFPTNFDDNCGFINKFDFTISQFIQFTNDANAGQVPTERKDTFQVISPNAVDDATLTISFLGDSKDAGEFFNIFGENGALLGTTSLGDSTSECTAATIATFIIQKDIINTWAADGQVIITAIPNLDAANFTDFINPCDTLKSDQTDGKSLLTIGLTFPSVTVNYSIVNKDSLNVGTGILSSPTSVATENLPVGINTVTYAVTDAANNTASCQFTIEVKDTIAPIVECNSNFVVETNPSGLTTTNLDLVPDSLIGSLSDNCGIERIMVVPNGVSCDDMGLVTANIVVVDSSGNTGSCQAEIQVITESLDPTFSVGACDNDTLYLFADTVFQTPSDPNTVFIYNWTGPNNFASNEANPFIPSVNVVNSGTYSLTITGATGCTSSGNVFVNINSLDVPPINVTKNTICTDEGITLTTSPVSCNELEYQWHEIIERGDTIPDTILLAGTSSVPVFNIENPSAGRHSYFVTVDCDECSSLGSTIVSVTAFAIPTAVTSEPIINICEGESISISTPVTDPTCTYSWIGPGYIADLPTPEPITNATEANEGVYTLTVSKNGCTSEAAFTVVNITNRPAKPIIANDAGMTICEGNPLVLKSNITNASTYNWTNISTFATFTTTTPELRFDTASLQDAGMWSVNIEAFTCPSEESNPINVMVEAKPNGTPFFEGVACESRNIQLNVNPIIAGAAYEWRDNDGAIFFGTTPEVRVKEQYTLKITSVNGCINNKSLLIVVKETPIITTIFDSGDAIPCIIPDDTDIRIIPSVFPANDGTYTYIWTTPDGTIMSPMVDSFLMIPNASSSTVNGTYTLVVNTGEGCLSNPASNIVEVADVPVPNPTITANSTSLCEGQRLTLTATEYPTISAEYRWKITSIMDTITQSPILVLDSVTTAFNGIVQLEVYNGICPSIATASIGISVNSPLAQPEINPLSSFCSGDVISLATAEVPGATYLWSGPNFSATSSTPDIVVAAEATVENNGGYTVQVLSNGCTSLTSAPLLVSVSNVPNAPIANNSGDICLDNVTDIILFIDQVDTPEGVEFRWFNASNSELIAGPNIFKSQIIEVGNLPAGAYQFYATQTLNGCESNRSNITELILAEIPTEVASVCEENRLVCDAEEAIICANPPTGGIGTWTTQDANIIITNPNEAMTSIQGVQPGNSYTFNWILSNGVCGEYSAAQLNLTIGLTGSIAQVCSPLIEECEGSTINLCANPVPAGFQGTWSQPNSQAALGVNIDSPNASNSTVSTIEPGNPFNAYTFFWTVKDADGICPATDTVSVNVYGIPSESANIEDSEMISCNGDAVVTAFPPSNGLEGTWSSPNTAIDIASINSSSTIIENLSPGMNTLIWSLASGACINYSSDEIIVFLEIPPQAMDDVFDIGFSSITALNVMENDQIFSPQFEITILSSPSNGSAEVADNGDIIYTANLNFVGTDMLTYELCNPTCASDCSIATIELKIGQNASCVVPTIMTPNGDNINDIFVIPCIQTGNFPGNEVIIFNQWGDEIYRAAPYNNDWRGTYNGEDVPVGTYYYVISFDRNTEPTAGFLIIER